MGVNEGALRKELINSIIFISKGKFFKVTVDLRGRFRAKRYTKPIYGTIILFVFSF